MTARAKIAVSVECSGWSKALPEVEALVRRAGKAALAGAARESKGLLMTSELSLVLADDKLLRRLNRRYRGKDKPTNVLSFSAGLPMVPAKKGKKDAGLPALLGDVIIAYETARREAAAQRIALAHHLSHLVVHGTLHLLGYDHERSRDAVRMERLETDILSRLGIPDPYVLEQAAPRKARPRKRVADHGG